MSESDTNGTTYGYAWSGSNKVDLSWTTVDGLGSGDVRVIVDYKSKSGASHSISRIYAGREAPSGAQIEWPDTEVGAGKTNSTDGGLASVSRLRVYKMTALGDWSLAVDNSNFANSGNYGTEFEVSAPANRDATMVLETSVQNQNSWGGQSGVNFGDRYRYVLAAAGNTNSLAAGTYDYRVRVNPPGDDATFIAMYGTIKLAASVNTAPTVTATDNSGSRNVRPVINRTYDRWGNALTVTDPRSVTLDGTSAGWITRYRYNARNQMVEQDQPDDAGAQSSSSPKTYLYYDSVGRQVAVKDANGGVNGQLYDVGGNVRKTLQADGGVIRYAYSAFGDKTVSIDTLGNETDYAYDKLSNLKQVTREAVTTSTIDGNWHRVDNAAAPVYQRYAYDEAGRKIWQTDGNNKKVSYRYDLRGNVLSTSQPLGQTDSARYDAHDRKIASIDANGIAANWRYDADGSVIAHTDIGGATYSYTYDATTGQLTRQTNSRNQDLSYSYDAAGQLTGITDAPNHEDTLYAYDWAGNRIRERTAKTNPGSGINFVYQDNRLSYDTLGRLRDVADDRVHVSIDYDAVGNRTHTRTHFIDSTGGNHDTEGWNLYDAMNRQTTADAVNSTGGINSSQGHKLTYDTNGNRLSDQSWGSVITKNSDGTASSAPGWVTETYAYDKLNRLAYVYRDGQIIDHRYYDGADRVVQTGSNGTLTNAYIAELKKTAPADGLTGVETKMSRYDANSRLVSQRIYDNTNTAQYDLNYTSYDAEGNNLTYQLHNLAGSDYTLTYDTQLARYEGYVQAQVTGRDSRSSQVGTTTSSYDANGYLSGVDDSTQNAKDRVFVNDASGKALFVNQGAGQGLGSQSAQAANISRQLIVNGEVLARYGEAADPMKPTNPDGTPNYAQIGEFNLGYRPINGHYPSSSPGSYQVASGDSLQSIAQGAFGDSRLWWRIAQANGIDSDSDLRVGQTLVIPNRVDESYSGANTFRPYDPTQITGDTTPNIPPPPPPGGGGCGGFAQVLIIAVAVVATIYTAGALSTVAGATFSETMAAGAAALAGTGTAAAGTAGFALGTFGTAAVAGAVGSAVSQGFAMAIGAQDKFSWTGVALSALGSGVTAEVGATGAFRSIGEVSTSTGTTIRNAAAASAVSNAGSQAIAVATGLQDKFNWQGVAAAAAGSAMSQFVSSQVAQGLSDPNLLDATNRFITRATSGMAAGLTTAALGGGRVSVTQVATDSFGNSIGASLADANLGGSQQDKKSAYASLGMNSDQAREYGLTASDAYGPVSSYEPIADASTAMQGVNRTVPGAIGYRSTNGTASFGDGTGNDLKLSAEEASAASQAETDFMSSAAQAARHEAIGQGLMVGLAAEGQARLGNYNSAGSNWWDTPVPGMVGFKDSVDGWLQDTVRSQALAGLLRSANSLFTPTTYGEVGLTAASMVVPPLRLEGLAEGSAVRFGDAAGSARGLSRNGGIFSSSANDAGGTIWTSKGLISQNDFGHIVNGELMQGRDVHIITGVHGNVDGTIASIDKEMHLFDVDTFGDIPGVKIHNFPELTHIQLKNLLNGADTVIGGFCNSGACLAPFR